jgi:hypothetical protein
MSFISQVSSPEVMSWFWQNLEMKDLQYKLLDECNVGLYWSNSCLGEALVNPYSFSKNVLGHSKIVFNIYNNYLKYSIFHYGLYTNITL